MAKKATPANAAPKAKAAVKVIAPEETAPVELPAGSTPLRKTTVPKTAVAQQAAKAPRVVTHDMIATRAYFLSQRDGGSQDEHWFRAEHDLLNETV